MDFDIDVVIDTRIEETEKAADGQVDANPWLQEARSLPERIRAAVPPLTEMEAFMANQPQYADALKQRAKFAQLDAIDKTLAKMPKPEDLAATHPVIPEPELSYGDQLAVSNLYAQINMGLASAAADKIEALVTAVARDPSSPKAALLREILPVANALELKLPDGQPDYNGMTRLRLAAMRANDVLLPARSVLIERARAALEVEQYNLTSMRKDVEQYGEWKHPDNVTARLRAANPTRPMPSQRRMEAEERRVKREQKAAAKAAGYHPA